MRVTSKADLNARCAIGSPLGIVILGMVFWGGSDLQKQSQMEVKTSLDISRQIMYENSCMYGRMHNGHCVFAGPVGTGFSSYLAICGDVMLIHGRSLSRYVEVRPAYQSYSMVEM